MRHSFYDDREYREKQSLIIRERWKSGFFDSLKKDEVRKCKNHLCSHEFHVRPSEKKRYCSSSCSAKVNNSKRPHRILFCFTCQKKITKYGFKYCSFACESKHRYNQYILRWKQGLETGEKGISTRALSNHLRRYLIHKYGEKCSECGWNKINIYSKKTPLEVDHIDGNSKNNSEDNLRLLCPNCHSLTPYFRSLNKGNGRAWRMIKYRQAFAGNQAQN